MSKILTIPETEKKIAELEEQRDELIWILNTVENKNIIALQDAINRLRRYKNKLVIDKLKNKLTGQYEAPKSSVNNIEVTYDLVNSQNK